MCRTTQATKDMLFSTVNSTSESQGGRDSLLRLISHASGSVLRSTVHDSRYLFLSVLPQIEFKQPKQIACDQCIIRPSPEPKRDDTVVNSRTIS